MRISTIIPSYNRADLIGETLHAVLSQTRPPAEVIVVDDGSTDGTVDLIREQFGRHVTLLQQKNAGAGPARNTGFAHSTGDIINFMDSDDVPSLNTYEVQARAIEAGADMVYAPWLKTRMDGTRLSPEPVVLQANTVPSERDMARLLLSTDWITVFQPCLFRRSLIEAAGPYRVDLKPSEDMEMLYRILLQKPRLAHTPETILLYRVHPENQVSEQNLNARIVDRANFWILFQNYAAQRSDFSWLQRRMYRVKKVEVANEVRPLDAGRAATLERDIGGIEKALYPVYKLSLRVRAKLRTTFYKTPYGPSFGTGSLTPGQKDQIALLGYELP